MIPQEFLMKNLLSSKVAFEPRYSKAIQANVPFVDLSKILDHWLHKKFRFHVFYFLLIYINKWNSHYLLAVSLQYLLSLFSNLKISSRELCTVAIQYWKNILFFYESSPFLKTFLICGNVFAGINIGLNYNYS